MKNRKRCFILRKIVRLLSDLRYEFDLLADDSDDSVDLPYSFLQHIEDAKDDIDDLICKFDCAEEEIRFCESW